MSQPSNKERTRSWHSFYELITEKEWGDWQWQLRNRLTAVSEIERYFPLTVEEKRAIHFSSGKFYVSLTPYAASLMDPTDASCPIRRQALPLDDEFRTSVYEPCDSAGEGRRIADGRLVHLYPDRAIFFAHSQCVVYCRFCPHRKVEKEESALKWDEIQRYLEDHPQIREVIISGGEPLALNDALIHDTFSRLRQIPSVKTFRLETRILSFLPQRVTPSLVQILKEFQPLYLILHVNHPREITPEFEQAVNQLCNAGIPLASQTVLLRDINDRLPTLFDLFSSLFKLRIRPYRLAQMLSFRGTEHFRTSIASGLRLIENLRTRMSALALPEYVVDTAGGKIPLRLESVLSRNKKRVLLRNFEGKVFVYPEKIVSISS